MAYSAPKTADPLHLEPLDVRPVLVLTGESDAQKVVFYDRLPVGRRLLLFGAVRTNTKDFSAPPEVLAPDPADNYHRWWNNSWRVVESAGQENAGPWTEAKEKRLAELVRYAHRRRNTCRAQLPRVVQNVQFRFKRGRGRALEGRASRRRGLHRQRPVQGVGGNS
jgi:hypothetical protein